MKGKIQTALNNPGRVLGYLSRKVLTVNRKVRYRLSGKRYNPAGDDFLAEDWDTLIILDACRYDEFERALNEEDALPGIEGTLKSRTSRGSMSEEFIRGNFAGKELHDLVYVSGNPWFAKLTDEIDCEIHKFQFVKRDIVNGETCAPETVTNVALDMAEQYPDKRLLVHYIQPHQPYITTDEDGNTIPQEMEQWPNNYRIEFPSLSKYGHEDVVTAYRENLRVVLCEVERLLSNIEGKSVVTADHGELLGEHAWPAPGRQYGHPRGVRRDELVEVPWFVHQSGERRSIVADPPEEQSEVIGALDSSTEREEINQRLEDLGYKI